MLEYVLRHVFTLQSKNFEYEELSSILNLHRYLCLEVYLHKKMCIFAGNKQLHKVFNCTVKFKCL